MLLKFSCPAVSQIYIFTLLFWMLRFLVPNSTPIVTSCACLNLFSKNYSTRHDFPTPVSPITMNLNRYLYSMDSFSVVRLVD